MQRGIAHRHIFVVYLTEIRYSNAYMLSVFPIVRCALQLRSIRHFSKSLARPAWLFAALCLVLVAVPRCSSEGGGGGPVGSATGGSLPQDVLPIGDLLSGGQSRIVEPTATETVQLRNGLFIEVARDEILIALKPDVTRSEITIIEVAIAANFGVVFGDDTDFRLLQVRINSDSSENDFVDALDAVPGVLNAYLNVTVAVEQFAPANPMPDNFTGDYWMDQIRAREAWQTTTGDPAILVAIVDSGFNPSADVLDAARIQVIDADGLPLSGDTDGFTGHGTAVTAFVAGDGNRDDDSVGVAWNNDIVHVDIFEETFPGTAYVTSLLSSIRQAIEAGSQIVNIGVGPTPMLALNLGLETNFLAHRVVFRDAVAPALHYARRHNALLVFSAGNDGDGADANHPLVLDGVGDPVTTVYNDNFLLGDIQELEGSWTYNALIVGASVDGSGMAPFSRQGAVVSIAAPGVDVSFGDGMLYTGTSYAAALTSGTAALLHSVNPTLTAAELKYFMMDTSDPDALLDANIVSGRLDTKTAVDVVQRTLLFHFASSIDVPFTETGSTATEIFKTVSVVTPSSTITGLVTDNAIPPNPIPGAWVGVDGGPAVMTDLDGIYTIAGLEESAGRTVIAAAPGFDAQSMSPVTLPLNSTVFIDFALTPVVLVPDFDVSDVLFLIDTTGSMFDFISQLQLVATDVFSALLSAAPGSRFAVATFEDFPLEPFGGPEDDAYFLFQVLTDDLTEATNAIDALSLGNGFDGPESGLEGVFQAATGDGKDLNDDGDFDDAGEILPSSVGWSPDNDHIVVLATDNSFHDSDVETDYPGTGFSETVDAAKLLNMELLVIAINTFAATSYQPLVDQIGGEILSLADLEDIANVIVDGLVGVPTGSVKVIVMDSMLPPNPVGGAIVSVNGDDPIDRAPDGSFLSSRVPVGAGNWVVVSADGFMTQLVGPINVIENQTTTVNIVMMRPPAPAPLRLTTLGDPEPFVDPASPLFVPDALPEEMHTFVLRFQNQLNRPVEDLDYEFVLHAVYDGRLFDRIPVTVHVPSGNTDD